jgi:hypothetical protein
VALFWRRWLCSGAGGSVLAQLALFLSQVAQFWRKLLDHEPFIPT